MRGLLKLTVPKLFQRKFKFVRILNSTLTENFLCLYLLPLSTRKKKKKKKKLPVQLKNDPTNFVGMIPQTLDSARLGTPARVSPRGGLVLVLKKKKRKTLLLYNFWLNFWNFNSYNRSNISSPPPPPPPRFHPDETFLHEFADPSSAAILQQQKLSFLNPLLYIFFFIFPSLSPFFLSSLSATGNWVISFLDSLFLSFFIRLWIQTTHYFDRVRFFLILNMYSIALEEMARFSFRSFLI